MEFKPIENDAEFSELNQLYDECLLYLKENKQQSEDTLSVEDPDYDPIKEIDDNDDYNENNDKNNNTGEDDQPIEAKNEEIKPKTVFKLENETSKGSLDSVISDTRSERLRKLSQQLPKIIITNSTTSLNFERPDDHKLVPKRTQVNPITPKGTNMNNLVPDNGNFNNNVMTGNMATLNNASKPNPFGHTSPAQKKKRNLPKNGLNHAVPHRTRPGYGEHPKRLVSKTGMENVALISNVPFEKIRLLNDTFHTLINLRWRWIVIGTVVVHFAIWLVFAVFWYITALAHYDFEPDPPKKTCITGGTDFVTIFLASVEAQTTIGFGDRAIDEECPESIFLFLMQLILGTGLSGVLTCVVYAKLTRPEKLSRDGVGFSKKAVISMRDGHLCLMMRAWDLNYDHIISSEFTAHFVNTHRTKEGEVIRYYARTLALQEKQFLLWPVTLVHVIDETSPLYGYTPELIANNSYEITVSLKGASASMGTFTQSQTSYLPKEVIWGHRFLPVVKYDTRKQKYVIDHTKLDMIERIDTPYCSAKHFEGTSTSATSERPTTPGTPSSFSGKVAAFQLERSSSFRRKTKPVS